MTDLRRDNDDAAIEQQFTEARRYPLLTAAQEQTIDRDKWLALELLQQQFVTDVQCRDYLHQWALNLLHAPPSPIQFEIKEYYYLLRRGQVNLLDGGEQRSALLAFSKCLSGPADSRCDIKAISALQLPADLVVGVAETLLDETPPVGTAAALRYWHTFWPDPPANDATTDQPQTRDVLRDKLANYYAAREKLVNHNLRLVFSIAGRQTGRGIPYRDLIQNGVLGLIRAAEKFQYHQGHRFSTYAFGWINQSVRRAVEESRGIVRYPTGINEKISRLHRERMFHLNTTGTEPNTQTLARRLKMKPEALRRLQQVTNLSLSIDAPATEDAGVPGLGETLTGGPFEPTSANAEQHSLNRFLMQRIETLEPQERRVVIQRWGLDHRLPLTRKEIASQLAVSTEWVRQLEVSALAKLRNDVGVAKAHKDHQSPDR